MAFFDKFTKSVAEAGQKTIAKTKELADTTKLNSMISEQEKLINNLSLQVGQLYVSLHKEDYEEDFASLISSIVEAENNISNYRQQIRDIKGILTCENCGANIGVGDCFCQICGTAVSGARNPVAADRTKCSNCGAEVEEGMRFCTECGNPLDEAPAVENNIAEGFSDVDTFSGKICPNCGANVDDGTEFCTECGTVL